MKFCLVVLTASLSLSFPLVASQSAAFSVGQGVQQTKLLTAEKVSDDDVLEVNRSTTDGTVSYTHLTLPTKA